MDDNWIKDTSGFYTIRDGELIYAKNFVISKEFSLERDHADTYHYPIEGWWWFEDKKTAVEKLKEK